MIRFIAPIREKAESILKDENYLKKIIKDGAEQARVSAQKTIQATRELAGLHY
jgi:tryptophanyl-tRNA synthetase